MTTISRKTGIPVSTIFDKIKGYEEQFVQKFTVLVDFAKLGFSVRAKIFLKVDPTQRDKLKAFLMLHERVNNIYRVNNGFDFAIDCIFVSIKEVEEFVEELELQFALTDKHVFHIIDDIAREKVFTQLN